MTIFGRGGSILYAAVQTKLNDNPQKTSEKCQKTQGTNILWNLESVYLHQAWKTFFKQSFTQSTVHHKAGHTTKIFFIKRYHNHFPQQKHLP